MINKNKEHLSPMGRHWYPIYNRHTEEEKKKRVYSQKSIGTIPQTLGKYKSVTA